MGTSVSQGSSRIGPNWKPVFRGYEDNKISEARIINEIWRASENESVPISSQLKAEVIYNCFEVVKNSKNAFEALDKFNKEVLSSKNNTIIAEFAKRVIWKTRVY